MSSEQRQMIDKIEFIDSNKEIIKANILNKIQYKDDINTVVLILVLFLISENDITEEFKSLNKLVDDNKEDNISTAELSDILGIINNFINKVYAGTKEEAKILSKLKEYNSVLDFIYDKHPKTLKKALV